MDDIVFVGDWVKDRILGSGSFGIVVLWKHKDTGEKLAIKTCKWGDELTEKHKERWSKEVDMLLNCNNRNIVCTKKLPFEFIKGLEGANPSKLPILCMEYCSGGDLRQVLNRLDSSSGLKELEVRQILADVGNAMQFLHYNKITHRDLKPENIVLQINGPEQNAASSQNQRAVVYKLIDLGYAKEIDSNSVCASFVGTLQYLAPEILYSKTYSNSVDFWSFGLVAFEIICGVRPFLPNMAPVQWMPLVKKKSSDQICLYETYHGDVEYSDEVFQENHIAKPFKVLMEKWLRVALEWDPKLRGREFSLPSRAVTFNLPPETGSSEPNSRSATITIFSLLDNVLSKRVLKIFSVYTLSELAYEIDDSVLISTVKLWVERDTKISPHDQILKSQLTYADATDTELAIKYWNEQCNNMLYLFIQNQLLKDNVPPKVPKSIQRCLEQPKAFYNYNNSKDLYKCAYHLVTKENELFDSLITGIFVKAESLKCEGKCLLLKHNTIDKMIGKLITMQDILVGIINIGKKHLDELKNNNSGTLYLGNFEKIFEKSNDLIERITILQSAWTQLTVHLQSAARKSNELTAAELNTFVTKYNYHSIIGDANKAYLSYKKNDREYRVAEKQCLDIVKISYNCLKLRDKILQEIQKQPFILKMLDIQLKFTKMLITIDTASENAMKLTSEVSSITDELTESTWGTINMLSCGLNYEDVPYSVVAIRKQDFKVGESVSNHSLKISNNVQTSGDLTSLIEESLKIRHNHSLLNSKLSLQKEIMTKTKFDFSFLDEKNSE